MRETEGEINLVLSLKHKNENSFDSSENGKIIDSFNLDMPKARSTLLGKRENSDSPAFTEVKPKMDNGPSRRRQT